MPTVPLTHVYLSPHLDDAVLSCGGMIHRQVQTGERVVVVTVCAGDPPSGLLSEFAQGLHTRWKTPRDAVNARREEDLAALTLLSAEAIHLTVPDCIYRTDPTTGRPLYVSEEALFRQLLAADTALIRRTATKVSSLLQGFRRPRLYAPLAVGQHVDHQLTRQAAEAAGSVYAYFEDYPYAARETDLSHHSLTRGFSPTVVPLTHANLQAKVRAIAAYSSQISSFWSDLAGMEAAVQHFAEQTGKGVLAETVWRNEKIAEIA